MLVAGRFGPRAIKFMRRKSGIDSLDSHANTDHRLSRFAALKNSAEQTAISMRNHSAGTE